jgi:hypothetical protein
MKMFKSLVTQAFTPRFGANTPVFKHLAQLFYSYRYRTEDIEKALKEAFGSSPQALLFGSTYATKQDTAKVGVVSMSGEDQNKAHLLANYSREWSFLSSAGMYRCVSPSPECYH